MPWLQDATESKQQLRWQCVNNLIGIYHGLRNLTPDAAVCNNCRPRLGEIYQKHVCVYFQGLALCWAFAKGRITLTPIITTSVARPSLINADRLLAIMDTVSALPGFIASGVYFTFIRS